jgi:hypothetical protein
VNIQDIVSTSACGMAIMVEMIIVYGEGLTEVVYVFVLMSTLGLLYDAWGGCSGDGLLFTWHVVTDISKWPATSRSMEQM